MFHAILSIRGTLALPFFVNNNAYVVNKKKGGPMNTRTVKYAAANATVIQEWNCCAVGPLQQSNDMAKFPIMYRFWSGFVSSPKSMQIMADM